MLYIGIILFAIVTTMLINGLVHYIPARVFYDAESQAHEVLAPIEKKRMQKPFFSVSLPLYGLVSLRSHWQSLVIDVLVIGYYFFVYFCFGIGGFSILLLVFGLTLILLSLIDVNHYILPDMVTLPLLWLGLFINAYTLIVPLKSAVLGAILGYVVLWCIYQVFKLVTDKDGMGHGDFKLLAAIGAWFGIWSLAFIVLFSSLTGIVFAVVMKLLGREVKYMPFGVCLAIGWFVYVVFLHNNAILAW